MNRLQALVAAGLVAVCPLAAQTAAPSPSLALGAGDVRVVPREDGMHLLIKKGPGIASVMLTEAFELPDHKLATYSWRGLEPNPVNGAEKRLLNGRFLPGPNLFLLSSTVVDDPLIGPSFDIFLPPVLEYGNKTGANARYGQMNWKEELAKPAGKVWFSIRTFAKPYADYTGAYRDNAFEFSQIIEVQATPVDHNKYEKGFEDLFRRLGPTYKAADAADGVRYLKTLFHDDEDLVVCIDCTASMTQDLKALRQDLVPTLGAVMTGLKNFRLGLVLYKDYGEGYVAKVGSPLSSDPAVWIKGFGPAEASGGGDIPEAVIEALDVGSRMFGEAAAGHRVMAVFADAPQHDSPRGKVKESEVLARLTGQNISLQLVMLPVTTY